MAFKTQPIGGEIISGVDWAEVARGVAEELGATGYRLSFLYGSSNPSSALNPLAFQRALYAFEKLGVGGALPVLSFFGTKKAWTEVAETVIRALGHEPNEEWVSVLDANDNPIRVAAHKGSKLCFAVNVYSPDLHALESRTIVEGAVSGEGGTSEGGVGDDETDADGSGDDFDLDFSD